MSGHTPMPVIRFRAQEDRDREDLIQVLRDEVESLRTFKQSRELERARKALRELRAQVPGKLEQLFGAATVHEVKAERANKRILLQVEIEVPNLILAGELRRRRIAAWRNAG